MPELTLRVETSIPGWARGDVVAVERGPFVDALIDAGRVIVLADPESEALDQGDEPEGVVEVDAYVRTDPDGDQVSVRAHTRRARAE
jgi:hypothetical protein